MRPAILAAADVREFGALDFKPEALAARTDRYLSPAVASEDLPRNATAICGCSPMRARCPTDLLAPIAPKC
jgi:hypothetical protein